MAKKSKQHAPTTEDQALEQQRQARAHGGSFVNPGGVNHDTHSEPATQLIERTEHRIVRSVELEEAEAAADDRQQAVDE
jgi:hypothetical protein